MVPQGTQIKYIIMLLVRRNLFTFKIALKTSRDKLNV